MARSIGPYNVAIEERDLRGLERIEWERFGNNLYRLKVFGGWIVIEGHATPGVFVPDPQHDWVIYYEEPINDRYYHNPEALGPEGA